MLALTSLTVRFDQLADAYRAQVGNQNVRVLAEGVGRYTRSMGAPPLSLDAMAAVPGFAAQRSAMGNTIGYALAPALVDGVWTFDRAVIARVDPSKTTFPAVLAANACGAGAADVAPDWCGPSEHAVWWRQETRADAPQRVARAREGMNHTLQLFADYYSANQSFPGADDGLSAGTTRTLASLASYGGTAAACQGVWAWRGVPLDCADLFEFNGQPVTYFYASDKHIALAADVLKTAAGAPATVVADFDMTSSGGTP